jgi:frataxin
VLSYWWQEIALLSFVFLRGIDYGGGMDIELLNTSTFEKQALEVLDQVAEHLAAETSFDDIDIELQMGVLTLTASSGKQFVINKHNPTMQIWYSSPVSGAHYFSCHHNENQWKSADGEELLMKLQRELQTILE